MDRLQREGKICFHGVSVEKVEEGLKALEYPGVVSVQIVYNMLRQRPNDLFLDQARKRQVAVIARSAAGKRLLAGNSSLTANLTQTIVASSTAMAKHSTLAKPRRRSI